ncbi:DgyrCDS5366 [Dimorphilus gyrociliatus]|uniref:DgyrCDS5366 n=1 Tax=Dimorphilus gyrociliatus TaxID=2664684 RepID=A0A7I8VJP1_9ANNE|nr:DgyrCDS5366 [Dimorphilus gyrociliatus]
MCMLRCSHDEHVTDFSVCFIENSLIMTYTFPGDRFDEEPRHYNSGSSGGYGSSHMSNIDEWDSGRKSVAEEVFGKAKDLWNRARGFAEADVSAADEDFEDDFPSDVHRENSNRVSRFREFRDDDELERKYPERFSNDSRKPHRNSDRDADGNDVEEGFKYMSQSRASSNKAANTTDLIDDLGSKNNSSAVNGSNANGEFADFADFQSAEKAAPAPPSNPQSPTTNEEFSSFSSAPAQPQAGVSSNADLLTGLSTAPVNNSPSQFSTTFQPVPVMGMQSTMQPALQLSALDQTPIAPSTAEMLKSNNNNPTQKNTLWSNSSNLDINLDDLSISSQYKKTPAPSINQLQNQIIGKKVPGPTSPPYSNVQQTVPMNQPMYPGGVGGGVMYNSGMPQMPMMVGPQTGVMGMGGVAPMTTAQQPVNAQLKSRADKAFSSFGNFSK